MFIFVTERELVLCIGRKSACLLCNFYVQTLRVTTVVSREKSKSHIIQMKKTKQFSGHSYVIVFIFTFLI